MSCNFNQVTLVGRLTHEPDYKCLPGVPARITFTVAVNKYFKNGNKQTDFIPVCLWGRLADIGYQYLQKGVPVLVVGRVHVRKYETKEGENRKITEIVGESFQVLERHEALLKEFPSDIPEEIPEDDIKIAA